MKKQNTEIPSYFNNYLIPHLKNKIQRSVFQQKLSAWLKDKLSDIITFSTIQKPLGKSQISLYQAHIKNCQIIQKQFHLKYPIKHITFNISSQYYETIVQYVMEKKLHWIFKPQSNLLDQQLHKHQQTQIFLNLKLKKLYKDFDFNIHSLNCPSVNKKNKQITKKVDPDFQYNLLLILSVYLVSAFFSHFFTELFIDDSFCSQIYIILNHAFLDLQVSPNVFEIMKRKYILQEKTKNFRSLNVSQVYEKQSKKQESELSRAIYHEESFSQINSLVDKSNVYMVSNRLKEELSHREIKDSNKVPVSIRRMNSTGGFLGFESRKITSKNIIFLKPTSSIDQSASVKNPNQKSSKFKSKKSLNKNQPQNSRFNSFLRDAKQFSIPTILQQAHDQNYVGSNQEMEFYEKIKKCLHVDSLPPIIKKKMNINQYQKLNQLNDLEQIKRQVNSLDISSKKNQIKSNDLSLAMNTFISASSIIPKKKRHNTNFQTIQNFVFNQNQSKNNKNNQFIKQLRKEQKDQYVSKRLPIKSSNLKLPYQKSAQIYYFKNDFQLKDTKKTKQQFKILLGTYQDSSMNKIINTQKIEQNQKEMEKKLQQKKKKNSTQWKNYLNLLKKHQSKENIAAFMNEEEKLFENKKNISRKSYLRKKQEEKHICMSASNSLLHSQKQIKLTNGSMNVSRQSVHLRKATPLKQSINIQPTTCNNLQHCQQYEQILSNNAAQVEIQQKYQQIDQVSKYFSLEGQVNVHKESQINEFEKFDSFELRKKFKQFQKNCKSRDQKIHYSMFNVNNLK